MHKGAVAAFVVASFVGIGVCAGAAWKVGDALRAIRLGDRGTVGITYPPVEDPRPALAVVRVADGDGAPVAGAAVHAFRVPHGRTLEHVYTFDPAAAPLPSQDTTTDADGVATLADLQEGDWCVSISATGSGSATGRASAFRLIGGGHAAQHDLRVQLGAGYSVRGRALEGDGSPAAGALVYACASTERPFGPTHWLTSVRASVADDGSFELHEVPSGLSTLWLAREGEAPRESARVLVPQAPVIELIAPARRTLAHIRRGEAASRPEQFGVARASSPTADEAGSSTPLVGLTGAVTASDGTPLASARVSARYDDGSGDDVEFAWTTTGPDGTYTLADVPGEAQIRLAFLAAGHVGWETGFERADRFGGDTSAVLEPAHRIEAKVRNPDGSDPRDLRVSFYRLGNRLDTAMQPLSALWAGAPGWPEVADPVPLRAHGQFDADWCYAVDPSDRFVVYATAQDCAPTVFGPFLLAADGEPTQIEFDLDAGFTLHGRLLDPDGAPLPSTPVCIAPPEHVPASWAATVATTDAEGRFEVPHLPARPVAVFAGGRAGRRHGSATITPGPTPVDVRLVR